MDKLSREKVLASSSGWVASLLNLLPGLGAGYLYQRRWIPYFITLAALTLWFFIGITLQGDKEPIQNEQFIGISGLFIISIVTAVESNLAYKKIVQTESIKQNQTKSTEKKRWF